MRETSRAITTFCWLPPESELAERERAAAAHVELVDQAAAPARSSRFGKSQPNRAIRRLVVVVQRDVLGEREVEHEPAPVAVLGDVADPGVEHPPRRSVPLDRRAADRDRTLLDRARSPVIASIKLGLAVAVDAGDRDDLAAAHVEGDAAHLLEPAVVEHVEVVELERDLARRAPASCRRAGAPRGRPSSARATSSVAPSRGTVSIRLAAAEDGDPVGDLEHLVQLVADEDDRLSPRAVQRFGRSRRARPPPAASAPRSARRGSGCRRCGRAPSGSRRAAAGRR